jgi:hypothetical protein
MSKNGRKYSESINSTRKRESGNSILSNSSQFDLKTLELELKAHIIGEVRFDDGARAMYSTDSSNYRMPPIGVVLPKSRHDIIETIRIARKYGAPILSRAEDEFGRSML